MFMRQNTAFLEQLQQEVPRRSLTPKATQRFEDAYKLLGLQYASPVKKRHHKGLWITAAAMCLCCGMLFGVNAAFPAFAESLPGVGRFFEAVNNSFQIAGSAKSPHGGNVGTYAVENVNISDSGGGYDVQIQQAFSDGQNASFTVELTVPTREWETYDSLSLGTGMEIQVHEELVPNGYGSSLSRQEEEGRYAGAISFALPENLQGCADGTELNLEVVITTVTYPDKQIYNGYLDVPVELGANFLVTVDASGNRSFFVNTNQNRNNEVQVLEVSVFPTETLITVQLPEYFHEGVYPALYTMEGQAIPYDNTVDGLAGKGGFDWMTQAYPQDFTLTFDGPPAGTEELVFRLYEENNEYKVKAEFTIDLVSETVAPSATYEEGGVLDSDSPFFYRFLSWQLEGSPTFTNHLALYWVDYAKGDSEWSIDLATDEPYRDILVEAYTAGGEMIGSAVSDYGTNQGQANWFWDENSPWWDEENQFYPYYGYRLYLDCEQDYMPAIGETVTVVVKENATGAELLRQDVTMDEVTN